MPLLGTPTAIDLSSVGQNKAHSAQRMRAMSSDVHVIELPVRLEGERLDAAVAAADVVLDSSDNFATRHAVNRACEACQES